MTTEEFKVLSDREHALARSGVYIGSITAEPYEGIIDCVWQKKIVVPGLLKIIDEIIQNSIDEHIRTSGEFSTEIGLEIADTYNGTMITVSDNGRGIPQEIIDGKPRPVWAWTELRAGSNFDDSKRITGGTNGMGAALTNIFSTEFRGETRDGKKKLVLLCKNNRAEMDWKIESGGKERGTIVSFIPDLARFGLKEFTEDHIDMIRDRLVNAAIMYPKITFKLTIGSETTKIQFKNIKQIAKKFHDDAIYHEDSGLAFVLAPSGANEEFRVHSYLNGIHVKLGGSHVDYGLQQIIESLRAFIKKKHKIDVLPNQIKQHLLFAIWVRNFNAPRFESQTKERITNSWGEVSPIFASVDFESISKKIVSTPSIIDPMIEAILYKKDLAERRELAAKQKQSKRITVVNHIAATDKNPENRILCIAEGLSAIGPLIAVRDPKKIGGYPLKGKIMNVRGMRPLKIMENKEISELLSIIGLEFGKKATDLNYGKIAIITDSDTDGAAIFCLLLNLFSNWPELFTEKRICRMLAPLYDCRKGKQMKIFYTHEEYAAFNSKGWDVSYYKGLGTMPKEVYKEFINNPVIMEVTADDFAPLEMAFGESSLPRKEWLVGEGLSSACEMIKK